MYFHPTVLHPAQKEQIANAYRELADILINGVDRQRELHVEASGYRTLRKIRDFQRAQLGGTE